MDKIESALSKWEATWALLQAQPEVVKATLSPAMLKAHEFIMSHTPEETAPTDLALRAKAMQARLMLLSLDGLGYLGELKQKFSEVKEVDRSKIITRPELFQGRQVAYSQETVDKILREGFDKSQEPIAVWHDPKTGKYVIISGHSRWHASELLFATGGKDLKTMSVKVFNGDLEQAQDYAFLESNRSGTAEGLKSDLKAYKRAIERGKSKGELLSIFKTEARVRMLQDLSYLNPTGRFLEYLGEDSEKSFPYLQRNAGWAGMLRRQYPQITDGHEKEMYEYMYGSKNNLRVEKDSFFLLIEKKVMSMYFDASKPLNLNNVASTSAYTLSAKDALGDVKADIASLQGQRIAKEEYIRRAKDEGNTKLLGRFNEEWHLINQAILRKLEEQTVLEKQIRAMERSLEVDLFNPAPAEAVKTVPSNDTLRIRAVAVRVMLEMLV